MISILFNILIVSVIVLPMAYFFMSGSNATKKIVKTFRQKASDAGLNLGQVDSWQKGMIGLDVNQNKVFYQSAIDNVIDPTMINLNDFSKCELMKTHHKATAHNQTNLVIDDVYLVLKPKDNKVKEVKINFYSSSKTSSIQSDLMTAMSWEKLINKSF